MPATFFEVDMASQEPNNSESSTSEPIKPETNRLDANKRVPSPVVRKRLQKIFEAAAKQDALEKYDYATDLYADCVRGDPGNLEYMQAFIGVLQKRYGSA